MLINIKTFLLTLCLASLSYGAASAKSAPFELYLPLEFEKGAVEKAMPASINKASETARKIIHAIVQSVGLKPNFEIREANISNAAAIHYKGRRFILYDAKFMHSIQQATQTDWAAVSILAHEIGHHLNGHTLMGKSHNNRAFELEADEFSGFVLRHMGASLEDAQKALRIMSSEKGSASHPGLRARMEAIEKGYVSAGQRILAISGQPMQKNVNL